MADAMTPEWWRDKLLEELGEREAKMSLMDAYYSGNHPLPFLTKAHESKMRDEFRQLLQDSRSNFMQLVVDAVEERLQVEGFRLSAEQDPVADKPSWRIWQANQMDSESQAAFVEALVKGVAYLSVWSGEKPGDDPVIAVEDPLQTIVSYVPGSNFRKRAAGLKVWQDEWTGMRRANVYLPDGIYKYQAKGDGTDDDSDRYSSSQFGGYGQYGAAYGVTAADEERSTWQRLPAVNGVDQWLVQNPVGIVPIVPLRNRPRVLCEGESEIENVFRVQNSINGFLFLLALAGYFGAHRQRWAVGLTIMEDERTGKPVEPFDVAIDKLWQAENPEAKFGEFQQTDLVPYIKAIEQKIMHIAVQTRTPRHYLFQEGQSPSGDAIVSAEAGLIRKVEKKQRPFGEGLEEALNLARRFAGEQDAPVDSEIVWADPKTESQAVITDAVIKQYAGGLIPWEAALERLGYTQTEIQRFSAMRLSDALVHGLAGGTGVQEDKGTADPAPPAPVVVRGPIIRA